jgi:hypothetical protein
MASWHLFFYDFQGKGKAWLRPFPTVLQMILRAQKLDISDDKG